MEEVVAIATTIAAERIAIKEEIMAIQDGAIATTIIQELINTKDKIMNVDVEIAVITETKDATNAEINQDNHKQLTVGGIYNLVTINTEK